MTRGYDSDRLFHAWTLAANASGDRGWSRHDFALPPVSSRSDITTEGVREYIGLSGWLRAYPWRTPIALTASTNHFLDMRQTFVATDGVAISPPLEDRSSESYARGERVYSGQVALGTGVGRVRDATPVHQVQVLEARLTGTGALTRPLSADARQKLAALFSTQSDVGFAHKRPEKHFWRELERVLREDGALSPGSLDAYDLFRLLEPISTPSVVLRQTGWFVGPTLLLYTRRGRSSEKDATSRSVLDGGTVVFTSGSSRSTTVDDRIDLVFTGLVAELHRPLDPRWQVDAWTSAFLSEAGEFLSVSSTASAGFIVSDRWLASLRLGHFVFAPGHGLERNVRDWDVSLTGELSYFLEDAWALRLAVLEEQRHSTFSFMRDGGLTLGITYVISGLFEAPGLVGAMHPTPPTP